MGLPEMVLSASSGAVGPTMSRAIPSEAREFAPRPSGPSS